MIATVYSTVDGAITKVLEGVPEMIVANLDDDEAIIEGNFLGYRIDLDTHEPVPLLTFDVSIAPNTVGGIPEGTTITMWPEDPFVADDDTLEIVTSHGYPETVTVILQHPLYETAQVEVYCEA